jgi:hypothetical protein
MQLIEDYSIKNGFLKLDNGIPDVQQLGDAYSSVLKVVTEVADAGKPNRKRRYEQMKVETLYKKIRTFKKQRLVVNDGEGQNLPVAAEVL